ncbi:MAG: hypothetical protein ISN28_08405 [Ectothiorhodospiraceae bacterium AqS1]|nr:hypothetical protein [Ectothiorhodospiraceae bacterium AqS1]
MGHPASTQVNEESSATFQIYYSDDPTDNAVALASIALTTTLSDLTLTPSSITEIPDGQGLKYWTITATAAIDHDGVDDTGTVSIAYTTKAGGSQALTKTYSFTIKDDDTPGYVYTPSTLSIREGESAVLSVNLATEPSVEFVRVFTAHGSWGGTKFNYSKPHMIFFKDFKRTNWSWSRPAGYLVRAPEDDNASSETYSFTTLADVRLDSGEYNDIIGTYTVNIIDNDTYGLTLSPSTLSLEEGGVAKTFKVKLDVRPIGGNVTVEPTSSTGLSFTPSSLTFTYHSWNTDQTFTVSANEDQNTVPDTINAKLVANGGDFDNVSKSLTVEVDDNDDQGVNFLYLHANDPVRFFSIVEGSTLNYNVTLASKPTGNVTIALNPGRDSDIRISPSSLAFTASNWNTAQRVSMRAIEDDDKVPDTATFSVTGEGGDYENFSEIKNVSIVDNDVPGIIRQPSGDITITEGEHIDFSLRLSSRPERNLAFIHNISDGSTGQIKIAKGSPTLEFSPENWNSPQTVTFVALYDIDKEDQQRAIVNRFTDLPVTYDSIIIKENKKTQALIFSPRKLEIPEGESANIAIRLGSKPWHDPDRSDNPPVKVEFTPSAGSSQDVRIFSTAPGAKYSTDFSHTTWNTQKLVTVNTTEDDDNVNDSATYTISLNGENYGTFTDTIEITVLENAIAPSVSELDIEEGKSGYFNVKLATRPSANAAVRLTVSDPQVSVTPTAWTFTPSNWNTPQWVTASVGEDTDILSETFHIDLNASNASGVASGYDGLTARVTIESVDDDIPKFSPIYQLTSFGTVRREISKLVMDEFSYAVLGMRLKNEPTANVTVNLSTSGMVGLRAEPATLNFTTSDWYTLQTFKVRSPQVEYSGAKKTLTLSASGGNYQGLTTELPVEVNDSHGLGISEGQDSYLFIEEGQSKTLTVVLRGELTDTSTNLDLARVDIARDERGRDHSVITQGIVSVSPKVLHFNSSNYNRPQTVTITGLEDDDRDDEIGNIPFLVSYYSPTRGADLSGDNWRPYVSESGTRIAEIRIRDTTPEPSTVTPGLTLSASILRIVEGSSDSFTAVLDAKPIGGNVSVALSRGDNSSLTLSPASLTFTASNWNAPQRVAVTTTEDNNAANESASVTLTASGANYAGVSRSLSVSIIDTDAKGLSFSATTLGLTEGSSKDFTVKLISQPSGGNVTVTLSKTGSEDVTFNRSSLTFTDGNWNTPQSVTISAADDNDGVDDTATITLSSSGADYAGIDGSIGIDVTDDDSPGLTIDPSTLEVNEENSKSFTVKLTAAPTGGNVTVNITRSGSDDVSISPSSLVFTSDSWGSVQSVTVSAAADDDAADDSATLSLSASGGNYGDITGSVGVTVKDDDTRGLSVSSSDVALTEGGDKDFTVKLTAAPIGGSVNVSITKGRGSSDISFSPAKLTFTANDWSTPQSVTVSAGEDNDGVKDVTSLTLSTTGADYRGVADKSVKVEVTDNDAPGLTIDPSILGVGEENSEDFTVKLTAAPTGGNVSVTLTKSGSEDVTFSPDSLTFTPTNWESTQKIKVSAAADDDAVDDIANLSLAASGADYADITGSIRIDVDDDDSRALSVSALTVGVGEGSDKDFTVRLTSAPTGDDVLVTVTKSGSVSVTASPGTLTFSSANWNTPQTVTVRAAEDYDGVNDTAAVALSASGADYGGVNEDVTVNVTDNDTPGLTVDPSSLDVDEGEDETIDVKLTTQPQGGSVSVDLTKTGSDDITLNPTALTFTSTTWSTSQTVTVSAADDDDGADDSASLTLSASGADYGNVSGNVQVDVMDDDTRGLIVSSDTVGVTEGSDKDFTFSLKTQPSGGNVTVNITKSGSADVTVSPASVTFTADDWNTPKTVTVSIAEDDDGVDDSASVSLSASGADYGSISADVTIDGSDNDSRGLTLDPSSLEITEGGDDTFSVNLTAAPSGGNVTVTLTKTGSGDVSLSPATLTFTDANWGSAQTVTVSAADDDDGADDSASISLSAAGGDYGNVSDTLQVEVDDDDDLGLSVSSDTVGLTEGKDKDFTFSLKTQPSGGNVSVDVTVSGSDDVTLSPTSVTFTADDWNTPKTVTVSAGNDDDGIGDTASVSLSASGADYGSISAGVTVNVTDKDTPGLTIDPSNLEVNEGDDGTLSLNLTTEPSGGIVTVDLTKSGSDAVSVSPIRLTFNTTNWGSAQTITVNTTEDDDGSDEAANLSVSASGGDYGSVAASVKIEVDDDDPRGLNVSTSSLGLTEGGQAKEFTFSLKTKPKGGSVSVSITKSGSGDVTVSPASVSFTTSNWNTPKTVTVSAADDDDGVNDTAAVSLSASGADYGSITAGVTIDVTDKDTPGLTIDPTSLDVDEGEDGSFNVNLTTEPSGSVTVDLTKSGSDDVSLSPTSLSFTASNWESAQTVTVSAAADDDGADDSASISLAASGADYGNVSGNVQVDVDDDDTRGLSVSADKLGLTEGGDKDLTFSLETQPSGGNVTVAITKSGSGDVSLSSSSVIFTASNWNTPQTVKVSAAEDNDGVDDNATISLSASGADYGSITVDVDVDVTDNDTPGLTVDPSSLDVDEGEDGSINVSLTVKPTGGNVSVTLTKSGSDDVSVSPASLTFTPSNWSSSRAVTVSAAEDDDGADGSASIEFAAQGADYTGVAANAQISVADNDTRGLTVDTSTLGLTEGDTKTFTVALKTKPAGGHVTVDVIASGSADVSVSPASIVFTASNWSSPRAVSVVAGEDDDAIKDIVNISLAAGGADYGGITGGVKVEITDNDAPALTTDPASTLEVAEGGADELQVSLTVQPSGGNVTVTLTKSGSEDVSLSPSSLTFTPSDWNSPRIVTVSAARDDDGVSDTASVTLVAAGADYEGITDNIQVQVIESQSIELVIAPSVLGLTEGGSGIFTAKLGAKPTGGNVDVYLTKSGSSDVSLSLSSMTFTDSNWNTEQSVTVTAAEDDDGVADAATVTLSASGADFGGVTGSMQVQVTDNDAPGLILSSISLPVDEGSGEDLKVKLAVQPSGDVSVSLTKSGSLDVSISPKSLTFTPSNWEDEQTVRVSAAEDSDGNSDEATLQLTATGADYEGITATVQVQVIENEVFGLNLRPAKVNLKEGEQASFTVSLSAQPIWNVSVAIVSGDPDVSLSPTNLAFTPSDWDRPQAVTVSAAEDDDLDADITTLTLTASGAEFDDITGTVHVTVIDNDAEDASIPQVTYDLILTPESLSLDEGASATFSVRANAVSTEDMVVRLVGGGSADVSFDTDPDSAGVQNTLTFTPDDWDVDQRVTVNAAEDDDAAPDSASASFVDTAGEAIITGRVSITVVDNDTAGLSATPAALTITETSSAVLYLQPDTRPLGNVLLTFDNGDADIALSPPNLLFTPTNWKTARSVTVDGAVDVDETDDEPADIVISAAGGGYDGIDTRVPVGVNEAEAGNIPEEAIPAFVIAGAPVAIDEGGTRVLHLSLRNRPTADVRVVVSPSAGVRVDTDTWREGNQATMVFSPSNFGGKRVVSVHAPEDENAVDERAELSLSATGGNYDGLAASVAVNIDDNDSAALIISTPELVDANRASFTVNLSILPSAEVSVALTFDTEIEGVSLDSDLDTPGNQRTLVFSPSDYKTGQSVLVGFSDDFEGDSVTISLTASGGNYEGIADSVTVLLGGDYTDRGDPRYWWPVRTLALAIPPPAVGDQAVVSIGCRQDSECEVFLDCSAQENGAGFRGGLPAPIGAWSVARIEAQDIVDMTGASWLGMGRLGCALHSREIISAQVWTRSGDGVLVNNSALVRSVNIEGVHRADIESIPGPGEMDLSNIRIRCQASHTKNCTMTSLVCYDDEGSGYTGELGTIGRHAVRHLQTSELADIIAHRWEGATLGCEMRSEEPFTVQVLTRTGGGGALVNNNATGIVPLPTEPPPAISDPTLPNP